jgi:hypothetical protein
LLRAAYNEIRYALEVALAVALTTRTSPFKEDRSSPAIFIVIAAVHFQFERSLHFYILSCISGPHILRTCPGLRPGLFYVRSAVPYYDDAAQPMLDCFGIRSAGIVVNFATKSFGPQIIMAQEFYALAGVLGF